MYIKLIDQNGKTLIQNHTPPYHDDTISISDQTAAIIHIGDLVEFEHGAVVPGTYFVLSRALSVPQSMSFSPVLTLTVKQVPK
jgi:hypothetical protein